MKPSKRLECGSVTEWWTLLSSSSRLTTRELAYGAARGPLCKSLIIRDIYFKIFLVFCGQSGNIFA